MLAVVVAGGMIGVALREALLLPLTTDAATAQSAVVVPAATMGVNVLGSLVLGIVVGVLEDRHPLVRAFIGTGLLGGFTTYSAFALHTAALLGEAPLAGLALAVGSVVLGLAAAAFGLRLGRRGRPGRGAAPSSGPEVPT